MCPVRLSLEHIWNISYNRTFSRESVGNLIETPTNCGNLKDWIMGHVVWWKYDIWSAYIISKVMCRKKRVWKIDQTLNSSQHASSRRDAILERKLSYLSYIFLRVKSCWLWLCDYFHPDDHGVLFSVILLAMMNATIRVLSKQSNVAMSNSAANKVLQLDRGLAISPSSNFPNLIRSVRNETGKVLSSTLMRFKNR